MLKYQLEKARDYKWRRTETIEDVEELNATRKNFNNHSIAGLFCDARVPCAVNMPGLQPAFDRRFQDDNVPFGTVLSSMRNVFLSSCRQLPDDTFERNGFQWMEQVNNCSAESSSRKAAAKESSKKESDNWFFMYFRIRLENYGSLVATELSKKINVFTEEIIDRWTYKLRFRMQRSACMKTAMTAFSSRFGLLNNPDVMFCTDGFFGDPLTGRIGNSMGVPVQVLPAAVTPVALGLHNGASIFVCLINDDIRQRAYSQMKTDLAEVTSDSDPDETNSTHSDPTNPADIFPDEFTVM